MELLSKEIVYANTQTLLSESLRELAKSTQTNIVFSESTLGTTPARIIPKGRRSLQQVLELLLSDTWFDYLVIGHTVAIVTATKRDKPKTDSTQRAVSRHIVTNVNQSFDHIPPKERRLMRKILLQELDQRQLKIVEKNDTTYVVPLQYPQHKAFVQLGMPLYTLQHRSASTAWKSDLSYKSHARLSLATRFGFEMHHKKYQLSAGIGFQKLGVEATWIDSSEIPPIEVPPASPAGKPKYKAALDQYLITNLFISAGYPLHYKKHCFSPTLGLTYSYVRYGKKSPKKFEKYYKLNNADAKYVEQTYRHLLAPNLGLCYEYKLSPQWSLKSNLEYVFYINPIASNSLFKTFPHHFSIYFGIAYSLN